MNAIDSYVADLGSRLHVGRRHLTLLLDEVRDHLIEATDRRVSDTTSPVDRHRAEVEAVNAFGPATVLARQFNAAAGARAMRVVPVVAFLTGVGVVGGFLGAAVPQPRSAQPATAAMQISFFVAVLAFQVAVVAGVSAASRAAATWRTSAASGRDRALVHRCAVVSILALGGGVLSCGSTRTTRLSRSAASNWSLPGTAGPGHDNRPRWATRLRAGNPKVSRRDHDRPSANTFVRTRDRRRSG